MERKQEKIAAPRDGKSLCLPLHFFSILLSPTFNVDEGIQRSKMPRLGKVSQ